MIANKTQTINDLPPCFEEETSNSSVDLVFCTDESLVSALSVGSPLSTSDHSSIDVCLGFVRPKVRQCQRQLWLYQRADFDAINEALECSLFPVESIPTWSVDRAWSSFQSLFLTVMKQFIPRRTVPSRRPQPPWITSGVRRALRQRNKARRDAKVCESVGGWLRFKKLRNRAVSVVRAAKREFFASLSVRVRSLKEFWKVYKSLTSRVATLPSTIADGAALAVTPAEKACMLNRFFATCFGAATLHSAGSWSPPGGESTARSSPSADAANRQCGGVELAEVQCSGMDVLRVISRLQVKKASGPDGISAVMLKGCAATISGHLAGIFNHSLSSGVVPAAWKVSRITPIPKTDDCSLACNFRPISLLSLVGKTQERLVHEALLEHLLETGFLSDRQFGFRPQSSTQEALLSLTKGWHEVMDSGGSVLCVFLDLAKAFDSVPHARIMMCLHDAGVRDPLLAWFHSYLTGRSQSVAVEGASSERATVTSGVPQGSILGPLLFLVAFNDIFAVSLSSDSSLDGYADDVTYCKAIYGESDGADANEDLDRLRVWIEGAGFRLQQKKTKFMLITRKRKPPSPRVLLGEVEVERVKSHKLLGVVISEDLSWSLHISQVCLKSKRLLGCLYRTFHLASTTCLTLLYKAVVRPVMEYASCVWSPSHAVHQVRLERVQSFAAKVVTKCWTASPTVLKDSLQWPPLQERRLFQQLCVCNRILRGDSLISSSVFEPHPRPSRVHGNSKPLFKQRVRSVQHGSSFFHNIVQDWNGLPERVVSCGTAPGFKRTLRAHMWRS